MSYDGGQEVKVVNKTLLAILKKYDKQGAFNEFISETIGGKCNGKTLAVDALDDNIFLSDCPKIKSMVLNQVCSMYQRYMEEEDGDEICHDEQAWQAFLKEINEKRTDIETDYQYVLWEYDDPSVPLHSSDKNSKKGGKYLYDALSANKTEELELYFGENTDKRIPDSAYKTIADCNMLWGFTDTVTDEIKATIDAGIWHTTESSHAKVSWRMTDFHNGDPNQLEVKYTRSIQPMPDSFPKTSPKKTRKSTKDGKTLKDILPGLDESITDRGFQVVEGVLEASDQGIDAKQHEKYVGEKDCIYFAEDIDTVTQGFLTNSPRWPLHKLVVTTAIRDVDDGIFFNSGIEHMYVVDAKTKKLIFETTYFDTDDLNDFQECMAEFWDLYYESPEDALSSIYGTRYDK